MMEALVASFRAVVDASVHIKIPGAFMLRFGARLIHARSLTAPPSPMHITDPQVPFDFVMELEFIILMPRKGTLAERGHLNLSAGHDCNVYFVCGRGSQSHCKHGK